MMNRLPNSLRPHRDRLDEDRESECQACSKLRQACKVI